MIPSLAHYILTGNLVLTTELKMWIGNCNRSDEGLMLETLAFKLFTVANFRFQLSCSH